LCEAKISSYYEVLPSADCPLACVPHSVAKLGRGQKRADYLLFKQAVNLLLNCKARSSIGGIKNIISIRASMNKGLTDVLKMNFPDILPVPRPVVSFEGKRFYSTFSPYGGRIQALPSLSNWVCRRRVKLYSWRI
jgi:hypothetical protein